MVLENLGSEKNVTGGGGVSNHSCEHGLKVTYPRVEFATLSLYYLIEAFSCCTGIDAEIANERV